MKKITLLLLFLTVISSIQQQGSSGAPTTEEVPGIGGSGTVRRDLNNVPHIFAETDRDAISLLGRVHAEDRFFQMDTLRRTFSGTLAELVGAAGLASDGYATIFL